jgi:ketosteroid isomerase-like protein
MKTSYSKNITTALAILQDEIRGDVAAAMQKMDPSYSMTWVYKSPKKGVLFPVSHPDFKADMKEVYKIEGRNYDIKNITENKDVVMIEMVESYPDPETKKLYQTPLVIVMEFKDGKIVRGRHYCDPNLSYLDLKKEEIDGIFKK